ncbi:metal-dependent transcriptional regulator [Methanohalobium sp.]|uniref:metal-dependent transcriptional regulator n=1 Tax=Methanohalobium sp. TaxID=2837493 RepID=UPI0025D63274|nr:metal-dependent transcriptional regulator [Methanohalobium sp.]
MTTERTEDYLKTIEAVVSKKGYAQVKDVSAALGTSPSSVTGMFQKLKNDGYINYEKYGGVTLTFKGKNIAQNTKAKYGVVKDFLTVLGVDGNTADEDACRIEHVLTDDTIDVLTKFVEFIHHSDEYPLWLDHFKRFYETGEYINCSPATKKNFPVHGNTKNKQSDK